MTGRSIAFGLLLLAACRFATPGWAAEPASTPAPPDNDRRLNVAVVVFDHVEPLDFVGPAEVFWAADNARAFNVYTVAASRSSSFSAQPDQF